MKRKKKIKQYKTTIYLNANNSIYDTKLNYFIIKFSIIDSNLNHNL